VEESKMIMIIFVSALLVSLALGRQERRHRLEMEIESSRYGVSAPPLRPRIGRFEGILNVGTGSLFLLAGGAVVWILFLIPDTARVAGVLHLGALFIAAGLTLIVLGLRALSNSRRSKPAQNAGL
jgi:hypothetical protein